MEPLEQVIVSNHQGILLPQCLWLANFGSDLPRIHLLGLTGYMFDRHLPVFTRGLSLFHGWLPLLLVWPWSACWATTNGLRRLGPALPQGWCSSATFMLRPLERIWPTPTSPFDFFDHPGLPARAGFLNVG
jgi:hypothetical protein